MANGGAAAAEGGVCRTSCPAGFEQISTHPEKNEQRSARGIVTRRVSACMAACGAQEATPVSLNALKHARLLQAQTDLTEKYNNFIDIPEAADNEEAMNHDAIQHED